MLSSALLGCQSCWEISCGENAYDVCTGWVTNGFRVFEDSEPSDELYMMCLEIIPERKVVFNAGKLIYKDYFKARLIIRY